MTLLMRLAACCDEVVHKPFQDHEIETMARLLDIKYLYKDMGEGVTQKEKIRLNKEMLAELPPDTAKGLQTHADNCQTGLIRDLLREE